MNFEQINIKYFKVDDIPFYKVFISSIKPEMSLEDKL